MMFRHVMVPYDGSDHAKNALNYAKDLVAGDADAKLSVVHAVPSSYMGVDRMGTDGALDGVPYGMLDYEEYQGVVKRVLDELAKKAADAPAEYAEFWEAFGAVLKEGLYEEFEHRDRLLSLNPRLVWCDVAAFERVIAAVRAVLGAA